MPLRGGSVSLVIALLAGAMTPAVAAEGTHSPAAPAYSAKGADSCLGCHDDAPLLELFKTKHARPHDDRGPFGHGGLQCEACHGPGRAHVEAHGKQPAGIVDFGPHARASPAAQNAQCLTCHQLNAAHEWQGSVHQASNVPCAGCHTLHAAADPVRSAATQVEVCTHCHEAQHADLLKPWRHPLREGKMACTACHQPHGGNTPAQLVGNTVTETCTRCHAEYRGPFLWEHQPVVESCANCHEAHGSVQPALLKMRPPFLCQLCHEGAGHPSIANGPGGLPGGGAPSAYLLAGGCTNCHSQVHGSNHPSGRALMR
jgi:DmsE family decaheme c-type cytochrome